MKERPILFRGPMVRALLDGSKTETRRIVKGEALEWLGAHGFTPEFTADPGNGFSRYGYAGDALWVKETFAHTDAALNDKPGFVYRATDPDWSTMEGFKWKPSIFCGRVASRIWLDVTSVHIERLQAITSEGAINEGIERHTIISSGHTEPIGWRDYSLKVRDPFESYTSPINSYKSLWESINGAGSWELNPWVWVIKFKRRA